MSSDSRDHKRSGLAGQIEVEVTRDPSSRDDAPFLSSSSNPLSILRELVEQVEELEQTASESVPEKLSPSQMQQQFALFHKRNSALRRMLDKLN